jgi:uncharacterized protein YcfL
MKTIQLIALSSLLLAACEAEKKEAAQSVAGTYVREYSTEIKHPETGQLVGQSTFRDTLFIEDQNDLFRIRHVKWRLNDFDEKGWQNQQHAENRPMPVFLARFNNNSMEALDIPGLKLHYKATPQPVLYSDNKHQKKYIKVG